MAPVKVSREKVDEVMIKEKATQENGKSVIKVEGKELSRERLLRTLKSHVSKTGKMQLLLDHDREFPHGLSVTIQDAAKGAGMEQVRFAK
jgi:biopolymer transport protein ExbD